MDGPAEAMPRVREGRADGYGAYRCGAPQPGRITSAYFGPNCLKTRIETGFSLRRYIIIATHAARLAGEFLGPGDIGHMTFDSKINNNEPVNDAKELIDQAIVLS